LVINFKFGFIFCCQEVRLLVTTTITIIATVNNISEGSIDFTSNLMQLTVLINLKTLISSCYYHIDMLVVACILLD